MKLLDSSNISIAIPYHSNVSFLEKTLNSVTKLKLKPTRVLVRNDNRNEIGNVENLKAKFEQVEFLQGFERPGMVENWNACLELAGSNFVCLTHADDELEPCYLEVVQELIEKHPNGALYFCGASIIDEFGKSTFSFPDFVKSFFVPNKNESTILLQGIEGICSLLKGNFIFCPSVCYSLKEMNDLRFNSEWKQVQDLDFYIQALLAGKTLVGTNKRAYRYRRHSSNATVTNANSFLRFREEIYLFERLKAVALKTGSAEMFAICKQKKVIKLNLLYLIVFDFFRFRILDGVRKLRFLISEPGLFKEIV